MTELQPNPFAEFFDPHLQALIGPILVDEQDDGSVFDSAVTEQFEVAMTSLAEQMPEGDEEEANSLMARAVQTLMVDCFRAGMMFQDRITPDSETPDDPETIVVAIHPEEAAQMLMGLMSGEGAALRLVVDRGQN
jgi:hypothetical protein